MKKKLLILLIAATFVVSMCSSAYAARTLSYGMMGDDVAELQDTLAYFGYFYGDSTGYYGDMTEEAVMYFQYDYDLDVDGVAGPITSAYLGLDSSDAYAVENSYYSYGTLSRTLYNGMEGDDVFTLQSLLSDYGYFYSIPTGFFGDLTEAAVIAFQSDYGLSTDGVVGSATIGALTGSSSGSGYDADTIANYQSAILRAIDCTPSTGAGYCAEWVTQVLRNAGILTYNPCNLRGSYLSYAASSGLADAYYADNAGWNANDYWAYVCNSSDVNDLQVGMIVATRSTYTYLGRQFGHVGIYIGDGKVISSIGYLETLSLDEWNRRYNNVEAGSSIAWGFMPY